MVSIDATVKAICEAPTFDARIAEIRKIPGKHGSDDWAKIYADVARRIYIPALSPDFAYIHADDDFYSEKHFQSAYEAAAEGTKHFSDVATATIAATLKKTPTSLLAFRVITGLTRDEFAHAVKMQNDGAKLTGSTVDGHERSGSAMPAKRAQQFAETITGLMTGKLFGSTPSSDVVTKQAFKPDTLNGWSSVAKYATAGVPFWMLLHQRHYGGSFRQILDATSTKRGDIIEDAVEELFQDSGIPYIRTGAHNQAAIMERFGLEVRPAPDFVVFEEQSDTLRAILECKGANDGGTARDKALRFNKLRDEARRLGGLPVVAVLGGIGWNRVNDTLGPVLADTEGRVFTLSSLQQMLTISPFTSLMGTASQASQ